MTPGALVERYDLLLFDLDGVLYVGEDPVPHAPEVLACVSKDFVVPRAFITNNASRTPEHVVEVLVAAGFPCHVDEVVTSAQVAAAALLEMLGAGSKVLVVGGEGLVVALERVGLVPVRELTDDPVAVVQGFHPSVGWRDLAMASAAIGRGLPWVASNADMTIPTPLGVAPGNGSLIAAVATATGTYPTVVGKPETPSLFAAMTKVGSQQPLMIGDRLDTDIEAAYRAQIDSLLVLTGVTDVRAVVLADVQYRPTYICEDLRGLLVPYQAALVSKRSTSCGDWVVRIEGPRIAFESMGAQRIEGVRALAAAVWAERDASGIDATELVGLSECLDVLHG